MGPNSRKVHWCLCQGKYVYVRNHNFLFLIESHLNDILNGPKRPFLELIVVKCRFNRLLPGLLLGMLTNEGAVRSSRSQTSKFPTNKTTVTWANHMTSLRTPLSTVSPNSQPSRYVPPRISSCKLQTPRQWRHSAYHHCHTKNGQCGVVCWLGSAIFFYNLLRHWTSAFACNVTKTDLILFLHTHCQRKYYPQLHAIEIERFKWILTN